MFSIIGEDIPANLDFSDKQNLWCDKYYWSEKQKEEFKQWLKNYLSKSEKARETLMRFPHKSNMNSFIENFIFSYGFKSKNNDSTNI